MDIDELQANRRAVRDAWVAGRREGEWGVGPVLQADNTLVIMTWKLNVRARDVEIAPDGTITWRE